MRRGVINYQLVKERLGDVAPPNDCQTSSSRLGRGLRSSTLPQLASQYFPRSLTRVEFEAIKPTHRGLAPRCDTGKDLVARNPMAYLDGGGVHEGKAGAAALALLQVG